MLNVVMLSVAMLEQLTIDAIKSFIASATTDKGWSCQDMSVIPKNAKDIDVRLKCLFQTFQKKTFVVLSYHRK